MQPKFTFIPDRFTQPKFTFIPDRFFTYPVSSLLAFSSPLPAVACQVSWCPGVITSWPQNLEPEAGAGKISWLAEGCFFQSSRSSQPQNQQNDGVVKLWINFFEPSEFWNFKLGDSSLFPLQVFNGRTMQNRLLYGH